jgi:acetylornithine/succinyldiaminopimelate/putrescine aminotransferase
VIETADGRSILDFYGGHAVAALGYGHPALVEAVTKQCRRMIFQSNAVALDIRAAAAERLVSIAPDGLTRAFFVNCGAEANENALRIAIRASGRHKVLALTGGFHGRTAAAAAVTWKARASWYGFPNLPFDVDFIPRDDIDAARAMIDDQVAAVIFEPVQGLAGAYDLSHEFIRMLREQCTRHGAVLVADEVQCGMGRTGRFFAVEHAGVAPDLVTVAKGLGGGVPCAAVLATEELSASMQTSDLGTTFGGGPLAAAAIIAVVDTIRAERLLDNVTAREAEIRRHCRVGPVLEIRGKGLLLGLTCDRPAVEVRDALLENDILAGTSSDAAVLRLLPPLTLSSAHVRQLAAAIAEIS